MIDEEAQATGSVPSNLYYEYLSSAGVGVMIANWFGLSLCFVLKLLIDWWLCRWITYS